jgi:glycosyltransferase involved in cell wall biosynthesis
MSAPSITLAIPFHSRPDYLSEAVASVLGQSDDRWELVVCDDSSLGEAAEVLERFPGVRARLVRTQPGGGIAANWNACLDAASTDLVTLLHADDRLLPGYAGLMLGAAEKDPEAAAFFCRAAVIDERGITARSFREWVKDRIAPSITRPFALEGDAGLSALARGDFIMCPTLCYRRSRLGTRRFGTTYASALDLEMKTGILLDGGRIMGLPDIAYTYRRHAVSESELRKQGFHRFLEEMECLDTAAVEATRRGWHRAARAASTRLFVRLHLLAEALRHGMRMDPAQASKAFRLAISRGSTVHGNP